MSQTFIIDLDDFGSLKPGIEYLRMMREHYPNFKCTLFTTPFHVQYLTKEIDIDKLYEWGKIVAREMDWLEIAVHGFAHIKGECTTTDRKKAKTLIKASENVFKKIGIPFVKIFKAPHWEMSREFEKELEKQGYVVALDRNRPVSFSDVPKYVWNWSLDEKVPEYHTVKGHGHVWETNNGINRVLPNMLKIPTDVEFKFVSEYLEENGTTVGRVSA